MRYYFAWVDKTDTTFSDAFAREDEEIFSLTIAQAEGDFASADVALVNPRIGLLASTRKQWAWISYRDDVGTLFPLFFGRLVSVPQGLQANIISLTFVARPVDFEDQKAALAATLMVAPYWDPLFFSADEQADPDSVLEGRSALWHIDRLTGVVSISDINTGEDGQIDYTPDVPFYDSVNVSYSASPARLCVVQAEVTWNQTGGGVIDVTQILLKAYKDAGPPAGLFSVGQEPRTSAGTVDIAYGDVLIAAWPQFGQSIGGGWQVGDTFATVVGDPPLDPVFVTGSAADSFDGFNKAWEAIQHWEEFPNYREQIRDAFERSPGFVVGIVDHTIPVLPGGYLIGKDFVHGAIDVLWVPVWQIAVGMKLQWETARDRSETIMFQVEADVQPLLTDPGEDEIVRLTIDSAAVDGVIGDVRRSRYFATDRGKESIEHLLARARANLLARARAIDIQFQVPFNRGLAVTCRKSASIIDQRLPGGVAVGKIKAYSLVAAGDGTNYATVTIGCTVGRDGSVTPADGTPDYVDAAYVEPAYQEYDGGVLVPFAGDLGYSLDAYLIADDGVNLASVTTSEFVQEVTVEGGLDAQQAATQYTYPQSALTAVLSDSSIEAATKIANVKTTTRIIMRPVTGGPFDSMVYPTITDLKVPRTIDLENVVPIQHTMHGSLGRLTGAAHVNV